MNAIIQADRPWRDRIWNPAGTFWTFILQVLHAGSSCRDAVAMFLAEQAASGQKITASPDPSAYCQSRSHLPRSLFSTALKTVGRKL